MKCLSLRAIVALVLVGTLLAVLAADRILTTERQRVLRTVRAMASAAARADVEGIFSYFSKEYDDETMSLPELRSIAESFFQRHGPTRVRIHRAQVNISGDLAVAILNVYASGEGKQYESLYGRSTWHVELRRYSGKVWRVTRIVPIAIDGNNLAGWQGLLALWKL